MNNKLQKSFWKVSEFTKIYFLSSFIFFTKKILAVMSRQNLKLKEDPFFLKLFSLENQPYRSRDYTVSFG